jgi:hypothetical protein
MAKCVDVPTDSVHWFRLIKAPAGSPDWEIAAIMILDGNEAEAAAASLPEDWKVDFVEIADGEAAESLTEVSTEDDWKIAEVEFGEAAADEWLGSPEDASELPPANAEWKIATIEIVDQG